jgi:hypothetical protein
LPARRPAMTIRSIRWIDDGRRAAARRPSYH